jgi:hypothetical protein
MVCKWIITAAASASHKQSPRNEQSASRIDPLLVSIFFPKKHGGYVSLGEAQPPLSFDQCDNLVGNCHGTKVTSLP